MNEESDSNDSLSNDTESADTDSAVVPAKSDHYLDDNGSEEEDAVEENKASDDDSSSYSNSETCESHYENEEVTDIHYTARSGMHWNKAVPPTSRTRQSNIVRESPGPNSLIRGMTNAKDIFDMFVTPDILLAVLDFTNSEGVRRAEAMQPPCTDWKQITMEELPATLSLLYMSGVFRLHKVSVRRIWTKCPMQNPIFPAVMSGKRFAEILSLLRFDDKQTRESRRANDKFAPVRDVWNLFVSQCMKMYTPSAYLTVDEQLLGFRGKCPFRQYIKSKPDRYGIKLWVCADAETYYVFNMKPYLGREESVTRDKTVSLGSDVVLKLTEPLERSGRNITCDNFFTNVQLADVLLRKNLTLLGTVRRSNRDIPSEFQANRSRTVGSSLFGFSGDKTLVSFVPKRNRSVMLLSTLHNDDKLDETSKKPEIIIDYNRTKGGVDTVDQLCHTYSVKRSTRRWPLCLFYGLLDIAAVNSFVIFMYNNPTFHHKENCKRRFFLEELALDLMKPQLQNRQSHPEGLTSQTRQAMASVGYPCLERPKPPRPLTTRASAKKRKRCSFCPSDRDRKVFTECEICLMRVCPEHSRKTTSTLCINCC